jgi:hypothetical protein
MRHKLAETGEKKETKRNIGSLLAEILMFKDKVSS